MERWQSLIDHSIAKLTQNGDLDNLPGAGKPLNLKQDSSVPEDMRMAYKIMEENNVVPEWITLGKYLEQQQKALLSKLLQAVKNYQQALSSPTLKEIERQNIEARWQTTRLSFKKQFDSFNNQILSYNLKIPTGITHRHQLIFEREIEKLLSS